MSKQTAPSTDGSIRNARELGVPKMLLLGLQHMFAMFGATVLVPLITGMSVQVTLFGAGLGTLLFHVFGKFKVPAFMGSSFAFMAGILAVREAHVYADLTQLEQLQYAGGGIIVAGLLYLALAMIIKAVGVKRVLRFVPPVVTGPIVVLIGVILARHAVSQAETNWLLALISLGIIIIATIWGRGMVRIIPILLGLFGAYIVAVGMNFFGMTNPDGSYIIDFSAIAAESVVGLPPFHFVRFDWTAIIIMLPIAIATIMEHIGDVAAIGHTIGEDLVENPGLHRTLIGDGVSTIMSAAFGGPASTTYGENVGVLALTRVYDPRVVRLAAVYAVVLSFFPQFAAFVYTIPPAIVGGVSFILYGMISAVGLRTVVENKVDFSNARNLIIAAVILVCGLGFPNRFTVAVFGQDIIITALAMAALAGLVLNAVLPGKDYEFGKNPDGDTAVNLKGGPQDKIAAETEEG